MRSVWKGFIQFSLVTIPIRIYNAFEGTDSVSFRMLHKDDHGPIGYEKKCKQCGKTVTQEDIVKGYEYADDQFVIIENEDLQKVKLKTTHTVDIEGFVDEGDVDAMLFDTPYFAGPDGEVAAKAFNLFMEALRASGKIAIGRVVLRDRESVILIAPKSSGLVLYKLRYPNEVRKVDEVPMLNAAAVDKQQLKLATSLIDTMSRKFTDFELVDRYKEAVAKMVQAKVSGKQVFMVTEEAAPVVDIMSALKASISQAQKGKMPMEKARGKDKIEKPSRKRKAS